MEDIKQESKKYGSGDSNYFKFEEKGVYRIRILNQPKVVATHFFGKGNPSVVCVGIDEGCQYHKETDKKPSIKLCTYVIDRKDGKVKMAELPLSISYSINDNQQDQDFAFEEFPMPYDVKITYDPDNDDPKAKYRLLPSPQREPLTDEEAAALETKMAKQTPEQYVEHKKDKQKKAKEAPPRGGDTEIEYPKDDINPDDIPF